MAACSGEGNSTAWHTCTRTASRLPRGGYALHRVSKHALNAGSAYMHMVGDARSSVAAVAAGVVGALTGTPAADPVVSLAIGGLIIWSSWDILTESVNLLLEAAPADL